MCPSWTAGDTILVRFGAVNMDGERVDISLSAGGKYLITLRNIAVTQGQERVLLTVPTDVESTFNATVVLRTPPPFWETAPVFIRKRFESCCGRVGVVSDTFGLVSAADDFIRRVDLLDILFLTEVMQINSTSSGPNRQRVKGLRA